MKRQILTLVVALALMTSLSRAQLKFGGGGHAGLAFSSYPKAVSDFYGSGFGFGAHGDMTIIKYLTARLNLTYFTVASKKDKVVQAYSNQYGSNIYA